jgi:enoyl-CoA hydratase/carnithine racemase
MSSPSLLVSDFSPTGCVLTLNRPEKRNALSSGLVEALHDAIDAAELRGVRSLVLRGAGASLSSGFDLSDLEQSSDADLLARFVRIELLLQRLFTARMVTLALAHGRVAGAGADLFVACDRRVIVGDGTFSFPGAGFGIVLGTGRLIGRIGTDLAREVIRNGRAIGSEEALRIDLATSVTSPADVDGLLKQEAEAAARLERETAGAIHSVDRTSGDADLAHLVRSAARPGLRERILAYRARVRALSKKPV